MLSKEFLKEWAPSQSNQRAEGDEEKNAIKQQIIQIGKECKPYLSQVSDPLSMYRGISTNEKIIKAQIKLDNREPLGMVPRIQKMVNKSFNINFGEPFRFAMFGTGNDDQAGAFGNVYVVFPIGDFKYLWSPVVEDLNELLWREEERLGDVVEFDDITELLGRSKYTNTNLDSAIHSGNEIMIRASGYYAIEQDYLYHELEQDEVLHLLGIK